MLTAAPDMSYGESALSPRDIPPDPVHLIDLKAQYRRIKAEVLSAIDGVLEEQQFILGPQVRVFEEEVALYCGAGFGIGVASGMDALVLALRAFDIGPGDEVITTSFSFIASADTVTACGATPVFVDIDPLTFNMDPQQIEERITGRTRAILPVHLFGQSADMDPIMALAQAHGLRVIEDNAQALGATYKGRMTESSATSGVSAFSQRRTWVATVTAGWWSPMTRRPLSVSAACESTAARANTSTRSRDTTADWTSFKPPF